MHATQETQKTTTPIFDITSILQGAASMNIALARPAAPSAFPMAILSSIPAPALSVRAFVSPQASRSAQVASVDEAIRGISCLMESHADVSWDDNEAFPLPEFFPLDDLRVCRSILIGGAALQTVIESVAQEMMAKNPHAATRHDDLMFAGNIGLYRAEDAYHSRREEPFSVFLCGWARGEMIALLQNNLY